MACNHICSGFGPDEIDILFPKSINVTLLNSNFMKRKFLLFAVLLAAMALMTACSEVPMPCDCEVGGDVPDAEAVRAELILR